MDPLIAQFLERASRTPDRLACVSGGRVWTVGEIAEQAREESARLDALAVAPGSICALVAADGPAFLWGYLAARLSNMAVLMIDVLTPPEEQLRIAERLGAALLWRQTDERSDATPDLISLPGGAYIPAGTAALKLTSGSTGEPAGVAVSANSLVADARALKNSMGFRESDRLLVSVPMSHSYGFSILTSQAFLSGMVLIVHDGSDPLAVARKFGVTILPSVPSWFGAIMKITSPDDWPPKLRLLISAGAPLSATIAREFRERFGLPIHAFYGSSECGGITYDRRGDAAERGSVGTPVEGVEISLLELQDGKGTVSIASGAVALGYVPERDESLSRLCAGHFTTEDLARFDGEELFLLGRKSNWINVKGKKVNPREVESVLMQLEGVREAIVLAQPIPGRVDQVVRTVIAGPGDKLGYREVIEWCRPRLSVHKIPRSVIFVDEIPRNGRGKVDRAALLALKPKIAGISTR